MPNSASISDRDISTTETVKLRDANVAQIEQRAVRALQLQLPRRRTAPSRRRRRRAASSRRIAGLRRRRRRACSGHRRTPPKAKADRMTERTSSGASRGVVTFTIGAAPSASARERDRQHEHEHQAPVAGNARISPETVGPIAGRHRHHDRDVAHHLAARLRRHQRHHRGHQQRHHDRRAATPGSTRRDDQHREARRDRRDAACRRRTASSPAMKTGRVLSRCSRKPVTGMTTAIVSRNAVVSHCAALGGDAEARPSAAGWRRS